MRYQSVNAIKDFEFHDSYVGSGKLCNGTLLLTMYALNIHKNLPQNPSHSDMEIKLARLCAEGFSLSSYEESLWDVKQDVKAQRTVYYGEDGLQRFVRLLNEGFYILGWSMQVQEDVTVHTLTCNGEYRVADVSFTVEKITIEWDEYEGKAWYEPHEGETE